MEREQYRVVLLVLDEKGEKIKEFTYSAETKQLAEFIWDTVKKRVEGYH